MRITNIAGSFLAPALLGAAVAVCALGGNINRASAYTCPSQNTFDDDCPIIDSVSPITAYQNQTIVIKGSKFDYQTPYNGDSPYLEIEDVSKGWRAGWQNDPNGANWITLSVTEWSENEITISGFTGQWGQGGHVIADGDTIRVSVWNPTSGSGPATKDVTATQCGPANQALSLCSFTPTNIVP